MATTSSRAHPGGSPITYLFGGLLALLGLVIGGGGAWLASLGGSLYYLVAGAALILCGVLVFRGRRSGAWLYFALLFGTVVWAVWEVGLEPWLLMPRLDGPIILAIIFLLPWVWRRLG